MSTTRRPITRRDVVEATIAGVRRTKADPTSLRITPGQRAHITKERAARRAEREHLVLWVWSPRHRAFVLPRRFRLPARARRRAKELALTHYRSTA